MRWSTSGYDVSGWVAIDIGASTGGFTDCLLQRGAAKVYAVDVGQGQLAWKLRQDPRVVGDGKNQCAAIERGAVGAGVQAGGSRGD
jgi:23S rRNA (cytidine1920-2'-O)/16S rRNA (cytidine1409-2'-O)-methyltransferase